METSLPGGGSLPQGAPPPGFVFRESYNLAEVGWVTVARQTGTDSVHVTLYEKNSSHNLTFSIKDANKIGWMLLQAAADLNG